MRAAFRRPHLPFEGPTRSRRRPWPRSPGTSRPARVPEGRTAPASLLLLDDPGDLEETGLGLGGAGQRLLVRQARPYLVGAVDVRPGHGMRSRGDVVRGDLPDLLRVIQDQAELAAEPFPLLGRERQAGQSGD